MKCNFYNEFTNLHGLHKDIMNATSKYPLDLKINLHFEISVHGKILLKGFAAVSKNLARYRFENLLNY